MSKPHIKRVMHEPHYGEFVFGWGLWHSKESYDSGDEYPVWSKELNGLREFYFVYRGLV